jgi:hypothetical protein
MADALPTIDPDVLVQLAEMPSGLLGDVQSHANKLGWGLAQFFELCIDQDWGSWVSHTEVESTAS